MAQFDQSKRTGGTNHLALIKLARVVACILLALTLNAAGFDWTRAQSEASLPMTTIRFVHAIPDAPPVDFELGDSGLIQGLAYLDVTGALTAAPGSYLVTVSASGGSGLPVVEQEIELDEGSAYIFSIIGQTGNAGGKLNEIKLDATEPGMARVRAINLASDSNNLSVSIEETELAFDKVGFGADSQYEDILGGDWSVAVVDGEGDPLADQSVSFDSGNSYDLIIAGLVGNNTIVVLPVMTSVSPPCSAILGIGEATDACVRFIQADPDLGLADVHVADHLVVEDLSFAEASPFIPISTAVNLEVRFTFDRGGQETGQDGTFKVRPGQAYLIVAWSTSDEPATAASESNLRLDEHEVDLTPLPDTQGRVRLIQLAPDTGGLDFFVQDGPNDVKVFDDIKPGEAGRYEVVVSGAYPIEIRFAGERGFMHVDAITVEQGIVYDIVTMGRAEDDTFTMIVTSVAAMVRSSDPIPVVQTPATPESE